MKPTTQSIANTVETLRNQYYFKRDVEVKTDVELYRQAYKLDFPEGGGFHEIKSPNTRNIPDRFADRIGKGRLSAHMEARKAGPEEKKHVETLERAAVALPDLMRKRIKSNVNRNMALHAANRGAFVVKFQIDMKSWVDAPPDDAPVKDRALWKFQQLERFPLLMDVRPIESIYPDPETDGDEYVIEHYERTAGDIRKNLPNWGGWVTEPTGEKNDDRRFTGRLYDDNERVVYTEVWTRKWRAVVIEGQFCSLGDGVDGKPLPAAPVPNPLQRPPYWIRYPFGDSSGAPEERCVGLLRAIRYTAKSESRMLSIIDTLAENEAYGATIIANKDQAAEETMSFAPGAVIKTDTPETPPHAYAPSNNIDKVMAAFGLITQQTERGSVPSAAIGQMQNAPGGGASAPSGVAASILTGESSMVVDPVKSAIEDFYDEFMPFVFFVLDAVVKKDLSVYGMVGDNVYFNVDLTSQAIDQHYGPIHFTLQLRSPEDDFARMNVGAQLIEKLPMEFILEKFFSIENAAETVKRMTVQRMVQSDEVVKGYLIPRLIEQLKSADKNIAPSDPGRGVAAPMGAPTAPVGMQVDPTTGAVVPQQTPADLTGASASGMDMNTRAAMRIASGPRQMAGRGPNIVTPGTGA